MLFKSFVIGASALAAAACDAHSTTSAAFNKAVKTTKTSTRMATFRSASVKPSSASVAVPTSSGNYWRPKVDTKFLYAINDPNIPANPESDSGIALTQEAYMVDLYDTDAATITRYKKAGKKVVCYFSAGSYEPWRNDKKVLGIEFDTACYCNGGSSCKMNGWNEWWLDVHSSACIANVKAVQTARMKLAQSHGCDAVDPDNVDSWTNKAGFGTTITEQLAYNLWIATTAHNLSMACGLKNAGDLVKSYEKQIVGTFDFSVIEQCQQYTECDVYKPFLTAKKPAVDIEYENAKCSPVPGMSMVRYSDLGLSYKNVVQVCA